jgi:hypothetical protein
MLKKPYKVIRLSSTSTPSGSTMKRYHEGEKTREVRITHSSWVKDRWRHWLASRGQASWYIETPYDATQILEILELEVCFADEETQTET